MAPLVSMTFLATSCIVRDGVAAPAVESSEIAKPARIYDLRSTFASNALAAGITVFELAGVTATGSRSGRAGRCT